MNMNAIFNNWVIRWNLFKLEKALAIQRYFDALLFLAITINLILDLVNLCPTIVVQMSIFNPSDSI